MTAEIIPYTGKEPPAKVKCSFCKKTETEDNPIMLEAHDENNNPNGKTICKNCMKKFWKMIND